MRWESGLPYELRAAEHGSELTGTGDLGHQSPQATRGDVNLTPEILQVVLLSQPMSWILLHKLALV